MKMYKNFYGTKEQYIEHLKERVYFWAKAFAEETTHRSEMSWALENAANELAKEGVDWDEIEAIEIKAMQSA